MNTLFDSRDPEVQGECTTELSVIIPLYNEHEIIKIMYARVTSTLVSLGISYELVLIDDGSRDGTPKMIGRLAEEDPAVTTIFLSRNFGKEAALTAGLEHAAGNAVVIMDADMQDPPELIPDML
ncbi:MAG TPA: glycosyltransferase, partial [Pusillimonas sp.]|nr:glycosyltransferase [Pusillimonas sp.]